MINSVVKMKFFEAAYNLLNEMTELDIPQTSHNAIMAGYFRENSICRGLAVLKQMKNADVKPNIDTYSYLICYATNEKVAVKFSKHFKYMRK